MNFFKQYRLPVLLFLVLIFLCACMTMPVRHYYQVRVEITPAPQTVLPGKAIFVDQVEMDDFYDNYRIVYRISPFQVNYYLYHLWFRKPTQMLREAMLQSLRPANAFGLILERLSEGEPDYLLKTRVLFMEEVYSGRDSMARLGMELRLVDFHSEKTILFHSFDRREKIAGKRVLHLVEQLSEILSQEMQVFIQMVGERISADD